MLRPLHGRRGYLAACCRLAGQKPTYSPASAEAARVASHRSVFCVHLL